ncbi:hypothetical protein [uncultured Aliiroseovarius sp.]|uniref:hypothetical protein n=1 Tax=uncultured Aliiroseovarius sp. TaxID=1658783 RepID=UPI00261B84EE|nr:hypothetical protein [uncultured Aliiroseovarius sp.]
MKLAKAFADIDSSDREPAQPIVKGFMPIGVISGNGSVSVSAFEALIPAKDVAFHGVRFEVVPDDEYAPNGIATVPIENAEMLVASLEQMASASISTERFALTEVEATVDELRIVIFNTEGGRIHAAIDADGATCHLMQQSELLDLATLVEMAIKHLKSNT